MKKRTANTRSSALNLDWELALDMNGDWPAEKILCALLADVRAELRKLNSKVKRVKRSAK